MAESRISCSIGRRAARSRPFRAIPPDKDAGERGRDRPAGREDASLARRTGTGQVSRRRGAAGPCRRSHSGGCQRVLERQPGRRRRLHFIGAAQGAVSTGPRPISAFGGSRLLWIGRYSLSPLVGDGMCRDRRGPALRRILVGVVFRRKPTGGIGRRTTPGRLLIDERRAPPPSRRKWIGIRSPHVSTWAWVGLQLGEQSRVSRELHGHPSRT